MWVNFKAKWRNQTVGELFLRTAERLPDKVSKSSLGKVVGKAKVETTPQVMITLCHDNGKDEMTFREVSFLLLSC